MVEKVQDPAARTQPNAALYELARWQREGKMPARRMHCPWLLVMLLLLALLQVGCNAQSPSMLHADEVLAGCTHANEAETRNAARLAEQYFRKTVGAELRSVSVEAVSACKSHWVVPIEAATARATTPTLWFVEIDREDASKISLVRPE